MPSFVLPYSARGIGLLCCVILWLLGPGSVDAGVIQSPRYLIKGKPGKTILKCYPMAGHRSVYWYKQDLGQGLQFLIQYFEKMQRSKGNIADRFSVQQFDDYSSELNMSSLEVEDSALYLCASSLGTALQSYWLSVLKPSCPS